ncbi:MAG TPA: RNA polymerase sporulation sigma factor SigH, partial [Acidobacteriaceae bacterium]|nr:RNA polymerase sporulation sigma factor SigH [Acidobacteriaceae bacterium]
AMAELLLRYRRYARSKARAYYLVGADEEDVVQEGMIGLYKAVRDYDERQGVPFRAFAELCITRQVLSAVKGATRRKHAPLNAYVSLHRPVAAGPGDEADRSLVDVLPATALLDPAEVVISAERLRELKRHVVESLSDLEVQVLRMHVEGKSYQEIAEALQRHVKAVDNALQRVKRKIESHVRARTIAEAG